jgi:hypothetical protein
VNFPGATVRTTLWGYHLGAGCLLALAYLYLPYPALRVGSLLVLLGTYDPSSPVEAGWLVAYALWGAAVLDPSVATSPTRSRPPGRS